MRSLLILAVNPVAEGFLIAISIVVIVVVLLQSGKTEGASAAIMGGNKMNIFTRTKERGVDKIMTIITAVLVVSYFTLALLCNFL